MTKVVQLKRLALLGVLVVVALLALGYRLVDLQVLRHDYLSEQAQYNTQRTFLREPRRGDLRDVRGNQLATSVFVKTVCADPVLIGPHQASVARALAPLLSLNEAELARQLQLRVRVDERGSLTTNRYVVLQRKVTVEKWQQIQQAMSALDLGVVETKLAKTQRAFYRNLRTKAIFADPVDDQLRVYPNQTLAAHVLGYVGLDEQEINGKTLLETAGKDGVERTLNSLLAGVRGWRQTETDRNRRELVAFREQNVEPRPGLNVVLTLDAGVQHLVESELAEAMRLHTPLSASAIVVRPLTGEILAMATLPNFDPNHPGAAPADHRRNRVISDLAEPGSTFKIVVVSGALHDQAVSLSDRFNCENGHFVYAGKVLRDHEAYGVLSVENIITKSSNIGAAKIGLKLGAARLYQHIRDFGFGERTGIPLPGEINGIVHPLKDWSKLSISRIPMGHEVAVTPLQMIFSMCAIANQGRLMRPMLIHRLEDDQGRVVAKYSPQFHRQVISLSAARQMVTALKTVVAPGGTAEKGRLDQYVVAGKTGTAQKAGAGGYLPGKYFASFIGFFPADDPQLCISVMMDEPHQGGYYGGQIAAPIFKKIAERAANYLNIRPESAPGGPLFAPVQPGVLTAAKTD